MSRKPKEAEAETNAREPPKKVYTVDEIRKAAFNWSELPPDDLDMPERILWYAFANLYKRFQDKELSKEQGEKLKSRIMVQYQKDRAACDTRNRIVQAQADMWKRVELAGSKYGTERSIEAADAFFEAVYDVKLKPIEQ